ncbi:MAG: VOC family protein [Terracidiphilus sp.]|nr:VOC family protein [Terracidiphilus sp.]
MKTLWIKTLVLLAFAVCQFYSQAQTPPITGIAHFAFRVGNLDQARAFFHKLGFEESFVLTEGGKASEVFVKINDRQFIELYPRTADSQPLGWMHVCFESDALSALNELYVAHGLKPPPVAKAGAGNLLFSISDPEGRITEFTQYMPGSRHTLDRGKHLGEHRISDELMGFKLPSADLAAERQFYVAGLGFEAQPTPSGVRLHLAAAPHLQIEIHAAKTGDRLQSLFRVPDAASAARQLSALGLTVKRSRNLVSVAGPDGNVFVFVGDK